MQIRPKQPIPVAMAKRHVAVVGAGFAGLAAARTLLAEGKGAVTVTLLEADGVVGGRGRRRELASGPVEMGATWFHGTEGNPVFDYAMNLISSSGSGAPGDVQQPQQDKPKDTTANATGNDERWELQLVAPGEATALSGARHQAILSAFEQYSQAVEDIAEDAEAAAAAVSASTRFSQTAADTAAPAAADGPAGAGSEPAAAVLQSCSLGQILRARFDSIVNSSRSSSSGSGPHQQDKEQQQQAGSQPASPGEVAGWLAADATGVLKQAFAEGWGCRERLQRAYDGFHSADVAGLAHMTEYVDLEGPNIPVPGGYQSIAEALAAEAQALGLQLRLNCPVDRITWVRPDGKVSLLLSSTPAAAAVSANSSSSGSATAGAELVVDAVVVTCSLGVLKTSAQQLFEPGLPASKAAAIQQLHIGQVEKLFVEWPAEDAAVSGQQQQTAQQQQQLAAQAGGAAAAAPALQPAGHINTSEQQQQPQQQPSSAPRQPAATPTVGPRKPKQLHDVGPPGQGSAAAASAAANAAGAAASPDTTAVGPGSSSSNTGGSQDAYTTYCLLWQTQPEVWGQGWWQQQMQEEQQALPMDLPAHDPVYAGAAAAAAAAAAQGGQHKQQELPAWLYGLHSWRYGDGPEWIKPAAGAAAASRTGLQPASRSAVIWVTGRAAQQMGQLSDQQVLQDLELLLQTYPAIPRPDGGKSSLQDCKLLRSTWTTSPFFRGSYSYPSTQADGSTADALAAPLTAADAAAAAAAPTAAAAAAAAAAGSSGQGDAAQGTVTGSGSGDDEGRGDSPEGVLVCFAGEATSRIHMGTVHGAFNSGVREAQRLLRGWGMLQRDAAAGGQDAAGAQGPAEYHAAFWL